MFKIILTLSLITGSLSAFAGDKVGNGGGLWTCSNQGIIQKAILVDLYEAQEEFGVSLITPFDIDPSRIVEERNQFARLNLIEFHNAWSKYLNESYSKIRMVNSELVIVDDSLFRIKPLKSTCNTDWIYTQFANFTHQDQILIRSDLWQNQNIAPISKAALIWHEVIYKWLRTEYFDTDSIRARQIVGYLFSNLPADQMRSKISNVLSSAPVNPPNPPYPNPNPAPAPIEKPWVCMIQNSHISTYYSDYGISQLEAKTKTLQKCQNGESGFFCKESSLKCDEIKNNQSVYTCQNKNNHISQTYIGSGRSLLEAEFKARESCQSAPSKFYCQSEVICE